jgi:shikimate kinase
MGGVRVVGDLGSGVVLIGLRRSGKTTVGRLLAEALGIPFIDLDELVAQRVGLTPREILVKQGEEAFRKAECEAVADAARCPGRVVAAGGGTPEREDSRVRLKECGSIIYLYVPLPELLRRLAEDPDPLSRPILAGKTPEEEAGILYARRDPLYRRIADHIVDGSGAPREVSRRCLAALRSRGPTRNGPQGPSPAS